MFDWLGPVVDFVGDFFDTGFGGDLISAGIKTAADFVIGGSGASGQQGTRRQPVGKIHGGVNTSRPPNSGSPDTARVFDTASYHADWMARMSKFSTLAAITNTGGPRTLGTQARRA